MQELANQMKSAVRAVRKRWDQIPCAGLILGSGLGGLAEEIEVEQVIDYHDIPHFPQVTAMGHRGRLVCGKLADRPVVAFQGRFHMYEGHSPQQASLPVRLLQALGAETLLLTNAAGGVDPTLGVGDLMLIEDQINLLFRNPLVGINCDDLGPRFPDMSMPFDIRLQEMAMKIALQKNITLHRGIYMAMLGPSYETRAEYKMARTLGADAVGMSTVPEVIAARHANMRVLCISTITNVCSPDALTETTGQDVLKTAAAATGKIGKILHGLAQSLPV